MPSSISITSQHTAVRTFTYENQGVKLRRLIAKVAVLEKGLRHYVSESAYFIEERGKFEGFKHREKDSRAY